MRRNRRGLKLGNVGQVGQADRALSLLRVNGRQIRLTGTFDDKGVTGAAGVVGALTLVPVVGFFVTGTSAVFPIGVPVGVFFDEDVQLAIADTGPPPLQVNARSPVKEVQASTVSQ